MSSSEQNIDISDNINTQETQDGERKNLLRKEKKH